MHAEQEPDGAARAASQRAKLPGGGGAGKRGESPPARRHIAALSRRCRGVSWPTGVLSNDVIGRDGAATLQRRAGL